jgi:hypothetical protein
MPDISVSHPCRHVFIPSGLNTYRNTQIRVSGAQFRSSAGALAAAAAAAAAGQMNTHDRNYKDILLDEWGIVKLLLTIWVTGVRFPLRTFGLS